MMPAANHRFVQLTDGTVISIRRLDAQDRGMILALADGLTTQERYLRFFTMHPAHLDSWVESLLTDDEFHYAAGAFHDGALLAVATYATLERADTAEVSVLVAHGHQGHGIGTALLWHIGITAHTNGIHHLLADILAENHAMTRVVRDAGWRCIRHQNGSVVEVDVCLDETSQPSTGVPAP